MRCALGHAQLPNLDPFLRLAHFRAGAGSGFADHPHRGFETITYIVSGRLQHRDSKGNYGELGPGAAQRMTAGRGIVHSEISSPGSSEVSGFQLWLNLPARDKMCEPRYHDVSAEQIPVIEGTAGSLVRVVCGEHDGRSGPLSGGATTPVFFDATLPFDSELVFDIPDIHRSFVYTFQGEMLVGDSRARVREGELAVLGPGGQIRTRTADHIARFLLISGKPLCEPIVQWGPFVMNTVDEIRQAVNDYQSNRF